VSDTYDTRTPASGTDDGTTTHRIGVALRDSLADGVTGIRTEQFMQVGHPLQWLQATTVTGGGVTTVGVYPNDATSVTSAGAACSAASGTTITLASGAPDWDITGWMIVILSGTGVGQVRRITAYNTGTRVATVATWTTTPSASDTYTIAFDCDRRSWLVVKAECEGTFAQSPSITVVPLLLDYPRTPVAASGLLGLDGTKRVPLFAPGAQLDMDNYDFQGNTNVASYYHLRVRSDQVLGANLAKVRLHAAPTSSKKVVLWLAAV
jgi:hypothetical protein